MLLFCKYCRLSYSLYQVPVVGDDRIQTAPLNWIYVIISLCGVGAGKAWVMVWVYYTGVIEINCRPPLSRLK